MIVETGAGRVRGVAAPGGVTAFLGVPYARAGRFAAPVPVRPWAGVRDAAAPGPAAPQTPSRLERVMGGFRVPRDEDCLSVNVWTPPPDGGAPRPVLVFLHGGGFTSGSGGLGWYGGAEFAAAGGVVVVTVNYRLGVPGFLRLPGVSPGNLGLLDQLAALAWVRDEIAAFGGDPAAVTVAGQSAGAQSILAMLAGGLLRRAILQSTPAGMLPAAPDGAERTGRLLLDELGLDPGETSRLADVPVNALLAAQGAVARRTAVPLSPVPPFQLVADGATVPPDPVAAAGACEVDVLAGVTGDEAAAFFAGDARVRALGPDDLAGVAAAWFGDPGRAAPDGRTAERIVVDMSTDHMFREPLARLARSLAAHGRPPWEYRFDRRPASGPFGACHCVELPFVLGTAAAWRDAPMLAGERPAALVARTRRAWAAFARDGDPGWARGTARRFTG